MRHTYLVHFFSTGYGDHRDLHSFPTRRSSDLNTAIVERKAKMEAGQMLRALPGAGQRGINLDRKSTRLNSSHSQISYAVFCLKKKRKPTYLRSRKSQ